MKCTKGRDSSSQSTPTGAVMDESKAKKGMRSRRPRQSCPAFPSPHLPRIAAEATPGPSSDTSLRSGDGRKEDEKRQTQAGAQRTRSTQRRRRGTSARSHRMSTQRTPGCLVQPPAFLGPFRSHPRPKIPGLFSLFCVSYPTKEPPGGRHEKR